MAQEVLTKDVTAKLEEFVAKLEADIKQIKSNYIEAQSYREAHNKSFK